MKTVIWLTDVLKKLGGFFLMAMTILSCADVVGGAFGYPILGCEEMVGLMAALVLAFALPITQLEKGHIGVDLLRLRLSSRTNKALDMINALVGGAFFVVVSWQCYLYASRLREVKQVSATLQLPTYLLVYCVSLACLILALVLFVEFLTTRKRAPGE